MVRRALALPLTLAAITALVCSGSIARASVGLSGPGDPRTAALNTHARYLVLIVLDGARPGYLNLASLPHVAKLEASGTRFTNAISGILEAETPAAHATISTGSTPRRSGILGFSWAANDKDFSLFHPEVVRAGVMEKIMQASHASTLVGLYKQRFPHAPAVALSGEKYYAADPLGGPNADAIMYFRGTLQGTYTATSIPAHSPPPQVFSAPGLTASLKKLVLGQDNTMVTNLVLSTFHVMHQRLTLINYPDFDWPLGHVDGGQIDRKDTVTLMQYFDRDLGRIEDAFRQAGVLKQTLFVITADHGMAPIKRYIPTSVIGNAIQKAGTSAPNVTNNSASYIWLKDFGKAQAVAQNIVASQDPGVQSVYYLASVRGSLQYVRTPGPKIGSLDDQANQYLLDTLMNGHEPTLVAFSRHNQTFSDPKTHWKGDHGGPGWESQHVPLIIAGPGIKKGAVINSPAQLEDIAPTVLTAMGVPPQGMEGHVLTDALDQPFTADLAPRSQEIATLKPLVQGMIATNAAEAAPSKPSTKKH